MTGLKSWVPEGLDLERPSGARIYDYLLGGGHNFAHDRELAERILVAQPHAREIIRLNRAFLRRVVLFMVDNGITQFLDLGSGIPAVGNVHDIAQKANPLARVVYVDNEEVAIAHTELVLEANDLATIVRADIANPAQVLEHPDTNALLDLTEPVGVLAVGVLHYLAPEDDPAGIMATYGAACAPGSYLGLSHVTDEMMPAEVAAVVELMKRSRDPLFPRGHAEIMSLFDGFHLVPPGLVPTSQWRPQSPSDTTDEPCRSGMYAGAGRRP